MGTGAFSIYGTLDLSYVFVVFQLIWYCVQSVYSVAGSKPNIGIIKSQKKFKYNTSLL